MVKGRLPRRIYSLNLMGSKIRRFRSWVRQAYPAESHCLQNPIQSITKPEHQAIPVTKNHLPHASAQTWNEAVHTDFR